MFEKRRKEIAARRAEIRALLAGEGAVDMDALEKELDALDAEERDLDRREAATRRLNGGAGLEGRNGQQGGHGDCQRRCDFVVFRRTGYVEKWRVMVYSLCIIILAVFVRQA